MKAYLMFKDRDFDLQQILIQRERKPHQWESNPKLNLKQFLPWNEEALIQDLGLDILFNYMSCGDNFIFETAKVAVLSGVTDTNTILYRQEILQDCIKYEQLVRDIYGLTMTAIEKEKENYGWGFFTRTPSSILHQALGKLNMFVEMLRKLRDIAGINELLFKSEGFKRLFKMIREELSDEYLSSIDKHLNQLKFNNGIMISALLGEGNKGTNYILNKPVEDNRNLFEKFISKKISGFSGSRKGYTYQVSSRDEAGTRALSELRNMGINRAANALAKSSEHILSFFQALRTELAFYIGCLNLHKQLVILDEPICFPVPFENGKSKLSFSGLYDICLSLSSGQKVISNNMNAEGKQLFVITGANTGGKSTFMRSVGIAQLMMQAGMYVPAEKFSAEVRDSIITHFKREEDSTMESGKLDEELLRMNIIVNNVTSKSMVLFNESFAATNEIEGSEIAEQITNALLEKGIKVLFVTHLYEFANNLYKKKMPGAIFLRAERLENGKRTFKLLEGEPLQTSYGEDLYKAIFV